MSDHRHLPYCRVCNAPLPLYGAPDKPESRGPSLSMEGVTLAVIALLLVVVFGAGILIGRFTGGVL